MVSVKVAEPQFEGQTKTKLGNSEVSGVVQSAVSEALRNYLEEHPKQAKAIVDKVALAATARHAAYNARMKVQRKSPLSGAGLPASSPTARAATRRHASSSSSRETPQADPPSRDATPTSRQYSRSEERYST